MRAISAYDEVGGGGGAISNNSKNALSSYLFFLLANANKPKPEL
jgi:hypothetical protein